MPLVTVEFAAAVVLSLMYDADGSSDGEAILAWLVVLGEMHGHDGRCWFVARMSCVAWMAVYLCGSLKLRFAFMDFVAIRDVSSREMAIIKKGLNKVSKERERKETNVEMEKEKKKKRRKNHTRIWRFDTRNVAAGVATQYIGNVFRMSSFPHSHALTDEGYTAEGLQ